MSQDDIKFVLRIPKEWHGRFKAAAEHESRSLNNYIIWRLINDEGTASRGSEKDHGENGTAGRDGAGDLRGVSKEARGLRSTRSGARGKGVRDMRGEVPGHRIGGEGGSNVSGAVLGPSGGTQSESSAMGGGLSSDSGIKAEESGYVSKFKHAKDCTCKKCR